MREAVLAVQRSHGNAAARALVVQLQSAGGPGGATDGDPLAGLEDDAAIAGEIVREAASADAAGLFRRATGAFRRGRFREAGALFEDAAAAIGGNTELTWNAAVAYRSAIETERRPGPTADVIAAARAAFDAGAAAYQGGDYRDAVDQFREALRLLPHAELMFNVGVAYYRLRQYADAREHLQAYQQASGRSDAARTIAECDRRIAAGAPRITESDVEALEMGEREALDAVLAEANRVQARTTFEHAVAAYTAGEGSPAGTAFLASARLDPAIAWEAGYNAGVAFLGANRPGRALEAFKLALGLP